MANIVGKWKLEKMENVDALMKAMEAPEAILKRAAEFKNKSHFVEISNNGGKWNIKNDDMKINHNFELGEEVEEVGPDGRKTKNTTTIDGDRMVTVAKYEDGKKIDIVRHLEGDHLVVLMTGAGVTARHEFSKA